MMGGTLWIVDWALFISCHDPTSTNQNLEVLGLGPDAWGRLLVVPLALVAVGLVALHSRQASRAGWLGKSGYVVSLIGLALWALGNLTLSPPGAIGIVAVGMVLFGFGTLRSGMTAPRDPSILIVLGILLIPGFVLTFPGLVLSFAFADAIGAFGLSGLFTHIAQGLGWILIGYTLWLERGRTIQQPSRVS
jgi:hypothetical protein